MRERTSRPTGGNGADGGDIGLQPHVTPYGDALLTTSIPLWQSFVACGHSTGSEPGIGPTAKLRLLGRMPCKCKLHMELRLT